MKCTHRNHQTFPVRAAAVALLVGGCALVDERPAIIGEWVVVAVHIARYTEPAPPGLQFSFFDGGAVESRRGDAGACAGTYQSGAQGALAVAIVCEPGADSTLDRYTNILTSAARYGEYRGRAYIYGVREDPRDPVLELRRVH